MSQKLIKMSPTSDNNRKKHVKKMSKNLREMPNNQSLNSYKWWNYCVCYVSLDVFLCLSYIVFLSFALELVSMRTSWHHKSSMKNVTTWFHAFPKLYLRNVCRHQSCRRWTVESIYNRRAILRMPLNARKTKEKLAETRKT